MTPEMAARVAELLRGTPEIWLRMQAARDLWDVAQDGERLAPIQPIDKRRLDTAWSCSLPRAPAPDDQITDTRVDAVGVGDPGEVVNASLSRRREKSYGLGLRPCRVTWLGGRDDLVGLGV